MKRSSKEIGDDAEIRAAKALGGSRVVQSGGGKFYKCDVRDRGRFIWSIKGTDKSFIRVTADMLREVIHAARGMRGTGDNYRAGMVLEIDGKAFVLIDLDDFADIVTGDPADVSYLPSSKGQGRLARARGSLLG